MDAPPRKELIDWVVSELGVRPRFVPCGWPQGHSRVWRLDRENAPSLHLKQFGEERKREQEIAALEGWVGEVAGGDTALPQLCATSTPELSSILLSTVPGEIAVNLPLDEPSGIAIHRRAGEFLATLHSLPYSDDDPMPLSKALPLRLAFWLERGGDRITPLERACALDRVGDGTLFDGDTRVPCHRDYQLRNWLILDLPRGDPPRDRRGVTDRGGDRLGFGVIDFEHARPDHPWVDFVRVEERAIPHYPSWFDAFLHGYTRVTGTSVEGSGEKLGALSAIHAVGSIVWGHTHGDRDFERAGHALLGRLGGEECSSLG